MSNKELFVAAAVQGLLAGRNHSAKSYTTEEIASLAVEIADYVLIELAKTPPPLPKSIE